MGARTATAPCPRNPNGDDDDEPLPRPLPRIALLLAGLACLAHTPAAVHADERDDQNTRDRIRQREHWTEEDLDEIRRRGNTEHYAAIAYSASTGVYGYAFDYGTRGEAQRVALARCGSADARLAGWARNGWYCAWPWARMVPMATARARRLARPEPPPWPTAASTRPTARSRCAYTPALRGGRIRGGRADATNELAMKIESAADDDVRRQVGPESVPAAAKSKDAQHRPEGSTRRRFPVKASWNQAVGNVGAAVVVDTLRAD